MRVSVLRLKNHCPRHLLVQREILLIFIESVNVVIFHIREFVPDPLLSSAETLSVSCGSGVYLVRIVELAVAPNKNSLFDVKVPIIVSSISPVFPIILLWDESK